ncbi:MAG TPA: hypothetical protein VGD23_03395 [Sphingomicrobium sp.]
MADPDLPLALNNLDVAQLSQLKASPGGRSQSAFAGLAAKLPGKQFFLSVRMTENDRTDFAAAAFIPAKDRRSGDNRRSKPLVRRTWHGASNAGANG